MKLKRYLIIGRRYRYGKLLTRITTNAPELKSHEIAIGLTLDIPESLFEKPALNAAITIPEDAVSAPAIEAEVVDNIEEIVSRELGVDLTINVLNTQEN